MIETSTNVLVKGTEPGLQICFFIEHG